MTYSIETHAPNFNRCILESLLRIFKLSEQYPTTLPLINRLKEWINQNPQELLWSLKNYFVSVQDDILLKRDFKSLNWIDSEGKTVCHWGKLYQELPAEDQSYLATELYFLVSLNYQDYSGSEDPDNFVATFVRKIVNQARQTGKLDDKQIKAAFQKLDQLSQRQKEGQTLSMDQVTAEMKAILS